MRWPPVKSWTSSCSREGFRHFVAINYGGVRTKRWVSLVAVLDGNSRLIVPWSEMKDTSKWNSGWLKLSRNESNPPLISPLNKRIPEVNSQQGCLHPSKDSGLLASSEKGSVRPWS